MPSFFVPILDSVTEEKTLLRAEAGEEARGRRCATNTGVGQGSEDRVGWERSEPEIDTTEAKD